MKDDLEKAKIDLLLERKFFGVLLSTLDFQWSKSVPTAGTDGQKILTNRAFWESLSYSLKLSLLAHEALHVGLLHHVRIHGRDPVRWNIACDMAINPLLREAGFQLPEGALLDNHNPPRSAEEIYPDVVSRDPPEWGWVSHFPGDEEPEVERIKHVCASAARQAGNLPSGISRIIDQWISPPKIPWWVVFFDLVRNTVREDYSSSRFSSRYIHKGLYLPSLRSPHLRLVVILDTSGSIYDDVLSQFSSAVEEIRATFRTTIQLLFCDTEVHDGGEILPDQPFDIKPIGGGGTDFRPPFLWISENLGYVPDCAVYFTDGFCSHYPPVQPFPVFFVVCRDNEATIEVK